MSLLCRILGAASVALAVISGSAPGAPAQAPLVLRGGRIFDGTGDATRPNPGILIRGGKLAVVGAELDAGELAGARVIELGADRTVLPGLFDLHAHYAVDLFGRGRVDETESYPALFLANGVTSTFPAGEMQPERMQALREAIDRGERVGPRIHGSGPYFGTWRPGWKRDATAAEIAAEVDHWAERGVRGFKAKGISPAHLEALIEAAHRHGLTVTGHLDSGYRDSVNPRDAIRMGIDRIEHFLGGDAFPASKPAYASLVDFAPGTPEFDAICALFVERGVYFDATLTAYGYYGAEDPEIFEPWADEPSYFTPHVQALVAARPPREPMEVFERIYRVKLATLRGFVDAGGGHLVTTGTDHPSQGTWLPAFGIHRELACFVKAGLTPAQALRCATANGARALGLGDRLGTLEAGKLADLVVVAGDPLADIEATRAVELVIRGGVPYQAAALLASARGTIGPATADEEEAWKPRSGR